MGRGPGRPVVGGGLGGGRPTGRTSSVEDQGAAYPVRIRSDPHRLRFEIEAPDGEARAGLIRLGHGDVPTPAFIPLATKGSVRGLSSAEVAELGYSMVLGNTFHLHLSPPDQLIPSIRAL